MSVFKSEDEMQVWLSEALSEAEGLAELILDAAEVETWPTRSLAERLIKKSYTTCLESLCVNDLLFLTQLRLT